MFLSSLIWVIFSDFCYIAKYTEILIELNFCLGMYISYIVKFIERVMSNTRGIDGARTEKG